MRSKVARKSGSFMNGTKTHLYLYTHIKTYI